MIIVMVLTWWVYYPWNLEKKVVVQLVLIYELDIVVM